MLVSLIVESERNPFHYKSSLVRFRDKVYFDTQMGFPCDLNGQIYVKSTARLSNFQHPNAALNQTVLTRKISPDF